jgi:branched-chain amino acid transport system permease protein
MTGSYVAITLAAIVLFAGSGALIEMVYHLQLNAALGSQTAFLRVPLDTASAVSWAGAAAVLGVGVALFEWARRGFARRWGQAQSEIEHAIRQQEQQG